MGFDDNRVKGRISRSDRCAVCAQLCDLNFVVETNCYHHFCSACVVQHSLFETMRCPKTGNVLKRAHMSKGPFWQLTNWSLRKYKLACDNRDKGCAKFITMANLEKHASECVFTNSTILERSATQMETHFDKQVVHLNDYQLAPEQSAACQLNCLLAQLSDLGNDVKLTKEMNLVKIPQLRSSLTETMLECREILRGLNKLNDEIIALRKTTAASWKK